MRTSSLVTFCVLWSWVEITLSDRVSGCPPQCSCTFRRSYHGYNGPFDRVEVLCNRYSSSHHADLSASPDFRNLNSGDRNITIVIEQLDIKRLAGVHYQMQGKLMSLELSHNSLLEMIDSRVLLYAKDSLTSLVILGSPKLKKLPTKAISACRHLQEMSLQLQGSLVHEDRQLSHLDLSEIRHLTSLSLFGPQFQSFMGDIRRHSTDLEQLTLNSMNLNEDSIPDDYFKAFPYLRSLSLSSNMFTKIPTAVKYAENLEILSFENNQIGNSANINNGYNDDSGVRRMKQGGTTSTSFVTPESFENIPSKVMTLNLRHNSLSHLPCEAFQRRTLKYLQLTTGNLCLHCKKEKMIVDKLRASCDNISPADLKPRAIPVQRPKPRTRRPKQPRVFKPLPRNERRGKTDRRTSKISPKLPSESAKKRKITRPRIQGSLKSNVKTTPNTGSRKTDSPYFGPTEYFSKQIVTPKSQAAVNFTTSTTKPTTASSQATIIRRPSTEIPRTTPLQTSQIPHIVKNQTVTPRRPARPRTHTRPQPRPQTRPQPRLQTRPQTRPQPKLQTRPQPNLRQPRPTVNKVDSQRKVVQSVPRQPNTETFPLPDSWPQNKPRPLLIPGTKPQRILRPRVRPRTFPVSRPNPRPTTVRVIQPHNTNRVNVNKFPRTRLPMNNLRPSPVNPRNITRIQQTAIARVTSAPNITPELVKLTTRVTETNNEIRNQNFDYLYGHLVRPRPSPRSFYEYEYFSHVPHSRKKSPTAQTNGEAPQNLSPIPGGRPDSSFLNAMYGVEDMYRKSLHGGAREARVERKEQKHVIDYDYYEYTDIAG